MWMLKKHIFSDERTIQTYRHIGSKMYALTVWLLILSMQYRRHFLGQSFRQDYWDIGVILLIPGVIYIAANLYHGGILPVRFKQAALRIYVLLTAISFVVGITTGRISDFMTGLQTFIATSVVFLLSFAGYYFFIYAMQKMSQSSLPRTDMGTWLL